MKGCSSAPESADLRRSCRRTAKWAEMIRMSTLKRSLWTPLLIQRDFIAASGANGEASRAVALRSECEGHRREPFLLHCER